MGKGFALHLALGLSLQGIIPNGGGGAEAFLNIARFQNTPRIMGALGPEPGQAIRLQFNAHLQFIGGALIHPALQPFHLFQHAQFMLDMMPDLMRDDIGRSKIPRRAKLAQQAAHEIEVNGNALIGGAVKRPYLRLRLRLRLRRAATGTGRAALKDQHRFLMTSAQCPEGLIPNLLGFRQHAGDETPRLIFREVGLRRRGLALF